MPRMHFSAKTRAVLLMNLPLWIPYLLMVPGLELCVVIGAVQTVQQWQEAGAMSQ